MDVLAHHRDLLASYGYDKTRLLSESELEERVATKAYCGGFKDEGAATFIR
jgi:hypothetical protein